jgi:hypothetical protein
VGFVNSFLRFQVFSRRVSYLYKTPFWLRTQLLLILFSIAVHISVQSQDLLKIPVGDVSGKQPLKSLLLKLENTHPVKFFFLDDWVQPFEIDTTYNGVALGDALKKVLSGSDVTFTVMFGYAVIFKKDPRPAIALDNLLKTASAKRIRIEQKSVGDRKFFFPGKPVTLRGIVKGESDGGGLADVSIMIDDQRMFIQAESTGNYSVTIPSGNHVLTFRAQNYSDKVVDLTVYSSGSLDVVLEDSPTILEEVVIDDQAIVKSAVGESRLDLKSIKRAPTFLGEVDIIKQIQTQPGVTTAGEIATGFNVRGGSVDQNLIQLDGLPLFNTAHAFGFFSAFNSDAIANVSFHRGGIPAEYGGRTSSVLNITSKQGDQKKWTGSGGIGVISSYVTLGGPIKRDTTTILASFRSSYSNWALQAIRSNYGKIQNSSVNFYDGFLKFSHKLTKQTKLTLSGYSSSDNFTLATDTLFGWNTINASAKIDHIHSERLISSTTMGYGQYTFSLQEKQPETAFDLEYKIQYPSLKFDFNYSGKHELGFGLHNTYYTFHPGSLVPQHADSGIPHIKMPTEKSLETAAYISDRVDVTERLFLEAGLRLSLYNRLGTGVVYQYEEGKPKAPGNVVDSINFKKSQLMKTYGGFEPRLSLRYTLNGSSSVKIGYNRMLQYLHLVTNTAAVTPVDIWQTSNEYFKPQTADQISIGYFKDLNKSTVEMFVEGYYKYTKNVLDFKDGANLLLNKQLETALLSGTAKSYGVEFSASKIKGRMIGTMSYTYSRALRQVKSAYPTEQINQGRYYAANNDQPHVVNLNWRYNISRRHFFSGNFTYHTGRPMTVPLSVYNVDGVLISDVSDRNNFRIPDYHRLDIAFIIEGNHKRKKLWDGSWIISFYNLYARKNAYSIFYSDNGNGKLRPYKLAVIGTVIPTLTYAFKF